MPGPLAVVYLDVDDEITSAAARIRAADGRRVADRHGDGAHDAAHRRLDDVLHLHRFHHEQRLPHPHFIAGRDREADHSALDRGHDCVPGVDGASRDVARAGRGLPVREDREWIGSIDDRACAPAGWGCG